MKKYFPATLFIVFASLFSCTKEDTIIIEGKKDLLINKKWQLTGITVKSGMGVSFNGYDSLPSYRKDDYIFFRGDATYEVNDHIDTMPGKHSRILDTGTWQLDSRQTYLKMMSDMFNTQYNPARIIELNSDRLSLERTHPGDGSVTTTTYKSL